MTLRRATPLFASLVVASALGGCASVEETNAKIENSLFRHGNWEQQHQVYQNRVEQVSIEHRVVFPDGRTSMTKDERKGLIEFLQRSRVGATDRVTLYSAPAVDAQRDPVLEARLEFVQIELGAFGIAYIDPNGQRTQDTPAKDEVVVMVDRQIVVTPDCSYIQPRPGERPTYQPGCANTTNLGLMVADPNDLIVGRPLGPADGEFAAKGIEDYRTAEEKDTELDETITSTTGDQL